MKPCVSFLVAWVLILTGCLEAKTGLPGLGAHGAKQPQLDVKAAAMAIPAGKKVRIRLLSKKQVNGRLGAVTNDSLEVKVSVSDKVETRTIAFTEIQSIKEERSHVLMIGLIVLGVFGVLLAVTIGRGAY